MMHDKWNEATTVKFVRLYSKHECLWNSAHRGYGNKLSRRNALHKIAKDMNIKDFGVDKIQYKINNLRSTYVQELNKIKRWKCSGTTYASSLKWFPIMDAIYKMAYKSGTFSSCAAFDAISDGASSKNEQDSWIKANKQITEQLFVSEIDNVIDSVSSNIKNRAKLHKSEVKNEDEFEVFGKYIAQQLKKLSPQRMLLAQNDIQSVITKYRLQEYESLR